MSNCEALTKKVRSFLSPSQKFGCKSIPTSLGAANISKALGTDLSQWNKQKNTINKIASHVSSQKKFNIRLDESGHKTNFWPIHKNSHNRQSYQDQSNCQDPEKQNTPQSNEFHILVRQMKQKIRVLEKQNLMLREQQIEDISLIKKQNEVIQELENVIKQFLERQQSLQQLIDSLREERNSSQSLKIRKEKSFLSIERSYETVEKNTYKQIAEIVIKLRDQRDFMSWKVIEQENRIKELSSQVCRKDNEEQETAIKRSLPEFYLQICAQRNQEINTLKELLSSFH